MLIISIPGILICTTERFTEYRKHVRMANNKGNISNILDCCVILVRDWWQLKGHAKSVFM